MLYLYMAHESRIRLPAVRTYKLFLLLIWDFQLQSCVEAGMIFCLNYIFIPVWSIILILKLVLWRLS